MVRKCLLACGILSSLIYVAASIAGALAWPAYSTVSQSDSELMAIEAPSRPVVSGILAAYAPLILAFGVGIRLSAGSQPQRRVLGLIVIAYGAFNFAAGQFPMHLREAVPVMTHTDAMHLISTGVLVLFIFLIMGVGANTFGRGFRFYSIVTILVVLIFGVLAARDGVRMANHLPTPWLGITERINIFGFMLWFAMLSALLLGESAETRPVSPSSEGSQP